MNKFKALLAAALMTVAAIGGQVSAKIIDPYDPDLMIYDYDEELHSNQIISVSLKEGERLCDTCTFTAEYTGTYYLQIYQTGGTGKASVHVQDNYFHSLKVMENFNDSIELEAGKLYIVTGFTDQYKSCDFKFRFVNYKSDDNPFVPGWKEIDGNWYFHDDNGEFVKNGWAQYRGGWYHFDSEGRMQKRWLELSGSWYYLNPDNGAMISGWEKIGGKWYFFNSSGIMQKGWQKIANKWYYFNTKGDMVTGWKQLGNKWYYFNTDGSMATGWKQISNKWYYFKSSGEMVTGWFQTGGKWYYFEYSGAMKTGWLKQGNDWYYLKPSGEMATGKVKIDGKMNLFSDSGVWKGYIS